MVIAHRNMDKHGHRLLIFSFGVLVCLTPLILTALLGHLSPHNEVTKSMTGFTGGVTADSDIQHLSIAIRRDNKGEERDLSSILHLFTAVCSFQHCSSLLWDFEDFVCNEKKTS